MGRRVILIISLICMLDIVNGFFQNSILQLQGRNSKNLDSIKHSMTVPLDHFDKNEKRSFKLHFAQEVSFWKPGGPIYIYIQTDYEYLNFDYSDSLLSELANATNGFVLTVQQRYEGWSKPLIPVYNMTEYYKFLSSNQIIEDIKQFIHYVKPYNTTGPKVVLVGAGRGGNYATWTRARYPEIVNAAVAISAPLQAKKDFKEFYDGLRYTYETYGTTDCLSNLSKTLKRIKELLKTEKGRDTLMKELNLAPGSDLTNPGNVEYLFFMIYQNFYGKHATYGDPDRILDVCNNYKRVVWDAECPTWVDFDPDSFLWFPSAYLTCTEFGQFETSVTKEPFSGHNPMEFFYDICQAFFEGDVENIIDEGIARTNQMYGGSSPNVTRVVFTHGDMDPYRHLGVLQDLGPETPVLVAKGTSRNSILYGYDEAELPSLTEQRKRVLELVTKWISD